MTNEHPDHEQLAELFSRAASTEPAIAALDRLVYCHLLDRITDGNLNVAIAQFNDPGTIDAARAELEALSDTERDRLAAVVCPEWSEALSRAVELMFNACRRLGCDPDGLGGDHLALFASILLTPEGGVLRNS